MVLETPSRVAKVVTRVDCAFIDANINNNKTLQHTKNAVKTCK